MCVIRRVPSRLPFKDGFLCALDFVCRKWEKGIEVFICGVDFGLSVVVTKNFFWWPATYLIRMWWSVRIYDALCRIIGRQRTAGRLFAETHNIPALIKAPVGSFLAFFFPFFSLFFLDSVFPYTTSQLLYFLCLSVILYCPQSIPQSTLYNGMWWSGEFFSASDRSSSLCWIYNAPS